MRQCAAAATAAALDLSFHSLSFGGGAIPPSAVGASTGGTGMATRRAAAAAADLENGASARDERGGVEGAVAASTTTTTATANPTTTALPPPKLDLSNVAPWVVALQVVGAAAVMASVSVLVPHFLEANALAPLRTLLLSVSAGAACVYLPAIGADLKDRAAVTQLFLTLRMAIPITALAWICESLIYSDCQAVHSVGALRNSLIVVLLVVLVLVSAHRALFPTSRFDLPAAVAIGVSLTICLIPQSLNAVHNPLGRQLTLLDSARRIGRVAAFAGAYLATAIAACPASPFDVDVGVLAVRALSATVWVLMLPMEWLLFVPFYVAMLGIRRLRTHHHHHHHAAGLKRSRGLRLSSYGSEKPDPTE